MMEASGVHRLEALTRQAVGHVSPLACPVGPHGFLKEASTCRIEVAGYVAFNDPLVRAAVSGEPFSNVRHCVIGASVWPESIRVSTEIGFPDWFQDHPECLLNNAVL